MVSALMKSNPKIFEEEVSGDVCITETSQYNHLNADSVFVAEDIAVRLFGTIRKKLVIGKNARVYLHGSLFGEIENNGGQLFKH